MAIETAGKATGTGRYYTSPPRRNENLSSKGTARQRKGGLNLRPPYAVFFFGSLLLLDSLSTVDNQLCAVPSSTVGGAQKLHRNGTIGQRVRNFRPAGEKRLHRAAFQRQLVALKKRKLDILSGPLRAGQRSSGRGRSGSGFRGGTVGSRSSFRSRRGFGSWRSFRSRCGFFCVTVGTVRFGGGRSAFNLDDRLRRAATGHNGDHNEAQQAQKNLAHLFTLSIFC